MKTLERLGERLIIGTDGTEELLTPELNERARQLTADIQAHVADLVKEFLERLGVWPGTQFRFEHGKRHRDYVAPLQAELVTPRFIDCVMDFHLDLVFCEVNKKKEISSPSPVVPTSSWKMDDQGNICSYSGFYRNLGQVVDYDLIVKNSVDLNPGKQ